MHKPTSIRVWTLVLGAAALALALAACRAGDAKATYNALLQWLDSTHTNYLTVMHASVQLPQEAWRTRDEARIDTLLQNIEHATDLMQNMVAQLHGAATAGPPTLVRRKPGQL